MGSEGILWAWMRLKLQVIDGLDIQRVESRIKMGVPDVEGCLNGHCFWIELKACSRPKRTTTKLEFKISQEQIVWLRRRWRCKGNAWVLVRVGHEREARVYLIKGCDVRYISRCSEQMLSDLSVITSRATPSDILHAAIYNRHYLTNSDI